MIWRVTVLARYAEGYSWAGRKESGCNIMEQSGQGVFLVCCVCLEQELAFSYHVESCRLWHIMSAFTAAFLVIRTYDKPGIQYDVACALCKMCSLREDLCVFYGLLMVNLSSPNAVTNMVYGTPSPDTADIQTNEPQLPNSLPDA